MQAKTEVSKLDQKNDAEATRKTHLNGYGSVLLRTDVRKRLNRFRAARGLNDLLMERCMVTAALDLLLKDECLHKRWIELIAEAVGRDVELRVGSSAASNSVSQKNSEVLINL